MFKLMFIISRLYASLGRATELCINGGFITQNPKSNFYLPGYHNFVMHRQYKKLDLIKKVIGHIDAYFEIRIVRFVTAVYGFNEFDVVTK